MLLIFKYIMQNGTNPTAAWASSFLHIWFIIRVFLRKKNLQVHTQPINNILVTSFGLQPLDFTTSARFTEKERARLDNGTRNLKQL
jgi:hypothetical protein